MSEITCLLDVVDRAYDRTSWHGTNLRGSIRGVTVAESAWRPGAGRHNIGELVVHAAYWKYAVWRRLSDGTRGSFPLEGSDFFERSNPKDEAQWKADIALLGRMHRMLREVMASLSPRLLDRRPPGAKVTRREQVSGIAAHDLYHAGQIQLIKRMCRS
jgi:hypothetical protein